MIVAAKLKELAAQNSLLYLSDEPLEASVYSKDMKYRYAFTRWWGEGSLVLWVLLNPTTRDTSGGQRRTLQRCIDFSRSWGHAGLIIGNLFAFRANDPEGLRMVTDPIGPLNNSILKSIDGIAESTVVAWGFRGSLHGRSADVSPLFHKPLCLGGTLSCEPRHPLYLPSKTHLQPWAGSPVGPVIPLVRLEGIEMAKIRRRPRWENEWKNLKAAIGSPLPGSRFEKLFHSLDKTPTSYHKLWQRAGFTKDPYLRTDLRKWAKAGWVDRAVDSDNATELWSLAATVVELEPDKKGK